MKKTVSLILVSCMLFAITACNNSNTSAPAVSTAPEASASAEGEQVELTVFAAASMTETMQAIAAMYQSVEPNVTVTLTFESSGTLKKQIEEGATCDFFISAGQSQMNALDISASAEANPGGLDFILEGTRVNLLENRITLCVPDGNPAEIAGFDDLAEKLQNADILFAMGNSDVPVGQYTQKVFSYYNLEETALANDGKITYGSNVKEVTTQISEASVSCGVVYCTDAFSAGLETVDYATAEMCGQVIYPAAVMKGTEHADAAQAFLNYLQSDEAVAVFENVGFAAVS